MKKNSELALASRCFFFVVVLFTKVGQKIDGKRQLKTPNFGRFGGRWN
jgi:hypothetical protein